MGFRIPDYIIKNIKIRIPKITFPTSFLFYSFPPVSYLFHPSYLPPVFIQHFSPSPSLPLSNFATSIPHVRNGLSRLITHSPTSFLSFHAFSLLVPTSKCRHHSSFFCTLFPQVLRNFLCHTFLLYLDFLFFPFFLACLCLYPFHSALYMHPSFFRSQSSHFFTGIPVSLVVLSLFLSLLVLRFFSFLSTIPLVSCTPPIHFVFKLCRSLSRFHSRPIPFVFFPHYVTWRFSVHS
jgi:hypothetical protein